MEQQEIRILLDRIEALEARDEQRQQVIADLQQSLAEHKDLIRANRARGIKDGRRFTLALFSVLGFLMLFVRAELGFINLGVKDEVLMALITTGVAAGMGKPLLEEVRASLRQKND